MFYRILRRLTLTTDDFNTHAGVPVPADGVKLDVSTYDWLVKVGVFHLVRVYVTVEHLLTHIHTHIQVQMIISNDIMYSILIIIKYILHNIK